MVVDFTAGMCLPMLATNCAEWHTWTGNFAVFVLYRPGWILAEGRRGPVSTCFMNKIPGRSGKCAALSRL